MSLESRFPDLVSTLSDPAMRPRARSAVTFGALVALIGAGVFGFDIPMSVAQGGLFGALFSGGGSVYSTVGWRGVSPSHHPVAHPRRRHARHARRHFARHARTKYAHFRRHAVSIHRAAHVSVLPRRVAELTKPPAPPMRANIAGAVDVGTPRSTCVKACPVAETAFYVTPIGPRIENAASIPGGHGDTQRIAEIAATDKSKPCSCASATGNPATTAFLNDSTLRPGDSVVTPQGVRVLRSGSHYPFHQSDFLSLAETRDVPMQTRGALAAIERAMKTPQGRAATNEKTREGRRHGKEMRSDLFLDAPTENAPRRY